MKAVVKEAKKEYINVVYCFDAIYTTEGSAERLEEIMNKQAELFGILSRV